MSLMVVPIWAWFRQLNVEVYQNDINAKYKTKFKMLVFIMPVNVSDLR